MSPNLIHSLHSPSGSRDVWGRRARRTQNDAKFGGGNTGGRVMTRGPKPKPTAIRRLDGNPGKRGYNRQEPLVPDDIPTCPDHLGETAREEWDRLAAVLFGMGVLTVVDRAALAAYCLCYGRWVEAEEKLQTTPLLLKTPSGYVQQSPWLSVSNKQLELMGRYMAELGLTPASRSRVVSALPAEKSELTIFRAIYEAKDGICRNSEGDIVDREEDGAITLCGDL